MRNGTFFLILMMLLTVFSACEKSYEIKKGSDFYFLAKALTIKFKALHPDSNFVIARSKSHEVTANELLHIVQDNEGLKLQLWRNHTPVQIKKNTHLRAEALIVKKELLQRADGLNISATNTEVDSAYKAEYENIDISEEEYLEELKKKLINLEVVKAGLLDRIRIAKYLDIILADEVKVTEEELQLAYQKSRNISFRHILLGTEGKNARGKSKIKRRLAGILKKIKKGADFSDMAKKYTQDAASSSTGGLYQDRFYGALDSAFAVAAFATPVGEVSDIFESSYGYHIIKVIDHKNGKETIEEATPKLLQGLRSIKRSTASVNFLEKFKKEIGFELLK